LAYPGIPKPAQYPAARPVIGPFPIGPVPFPLGIIGSFLKNSILISPLPGIPAALNSKATTAAAATSRHGKAGTIQFSGKTGLNDFIHISRNERNDLHSTHGQHFSQGLRNGPTDQKLYSISGYPLNFLPKILIDRLLMFSANGSFFDFHNHHAAGHIEYGGDSSVPG
jgi:hypothetical protein